MPIRLVPAAVPAGALALIAAAGPFAVDEGPGPVHAIAGGPFEASGAVQAPGGKGVLFVDDARPDVVLWMELGADGESSATPTPVSIGASVVDPEGITTDGTHLYVVGSQSRGKARGGAGLVRFRFDAAARRASGVEAIDDLASLLGEAVAAGSGSTRGKGRRKDKGPALNIEGLAWDAKGGRLLLGLRSPLSSGRAQVVPAKLRDPRGAFDRANLEVGPPIPVDLGGSGIRGMEADGTGGYWIIAGGVEGAGTSRLVRWDGSGASVKVAATFPDDLKPEGVAPTKVGGKNVTLVLCDTSQYLLMD